MATEASKIQVGIFVIAAVAIGTSAAIWLGASRYFENTAVLVAYFSESVQGLEPGAAVKYRGVPAGRVEEISIAPDGDLIEVRMALDAEFAESVRRDETLRAQLQLSGITGLRYVEIDKHTGEALYKSPELSFDPPYPVIKSTPSSVKAIQEALEDIYERIMSVDVVGVTEDLRATLQAADQILRDERVERVMTSLAEVSESAARVTNNLDRVTAEVEVQPVINDLRVAIADARSLLHDLRERRIGTQVQETLQSIDGVARTSRQFLVSLQTTIERLDRTAANMERLTEELRQQPSRLLFSAPPEPRNPAGGSE